MLPLQLLPSGVPAEAYYLLGAAALSLAWFAAGFLYGVGKDESRDLQRIEELEGAEGFEMTSYGSNGGGVLSAVLRERKKRKALDKGVVRWHLIGSAFEKPKYVKPKRKEGGNVPELDHDGETYYFPQEATVPSEEEGVPVMVHRKGESDPIELRDSWELSVDAGTLAEYLTLRVTSSEPKKGLLDSLGLGQYDSMTLFRYAIIAIVLAAIAWSVLGG